jgi:hypothetical protein
MEVDRIYGIFKDRGALSRNLNNPVNLVYFWRVDDA